MDATEPTITITASDVIHGRTITVTRSGPADRTRSLIRATVEDLRQAIARHAADARSMQRAFPASGTGGSGDTARAIAEHEGAVWIDPCSNPDPEERVA